MIKIAIDAMGGDFGPEPIVDGLVAALRSNTNFTAIAVGKKDELLNLIPSNFLSRVEILDTHDVISMTDSATDALKRKDSTIYKAIELVKTKKLMLLFQQDIQVLQCHLQRLELEELKVFQDLQLQL